METKYCINCGTKIINSATFCQKCGFNQNSGEKVTNVKGIEDNAASKATNVTKDEQNKHSAEFEHENDVKTSASPNSNDTKKHKKSSSPSSDQNTEDDFVIPDDPDLRWVLIPNLNAKKYRLFSSVITLLASAIVLLLCLSPAAHYNDFSLGNFYEVSIGTIRELCGGVEIQFIKNLADGSAPERMYIYIVQFALIVIGCLAFGVSMLFTGTGQLIQAFSKKDLCIRKRTKRQLIRNAVLGGIFAVIALLVVILYVNSWSKEFLLDCTNVYLIIAIIVAWASIHSIATFIYINKQTDNELISFNKKSDLCNVKKNTAEESIESSKKLLSTLSFLLIFAAFGIIAENHYFNPMGDTYLPCNVGEEVDNVDSFHSIKENEELVLNWIDDSLEWSRKSGNNYYFYKTKIKYMEETLTSSFPEGDSQKDIEKYLKEMGKLAAEIETAKDLMNRIPYTYEYWRAEKISYGKKLIHYSYDANHGTSGYRWDVNDSSVFSLCAQKVYLAETEFSVGTDFNYQSLVATIIYSDGSVRVSVIHPSNLTSLNNAGAGTYTIEWSDEWGEYKADITLKQIN